MRTMMLTTAIGLIAAAAAITTELMEIIGGAEALSA